MISQGQNIPELLEKVVVYPGRLISFLRMPLGSMPGPPVQ